MRWTFIFVLISFAGVTFTEAQEKTSRIGLGSGRSSSSTLGRNRGSSTLGSSKLGSSTLGSSRGRVGVVGRKNRKGTKEGKSSKLRAAPSVNGDKTATLAKGALEVDSFQSAATAQNGTLNADVLTSLIYTLQASESQSGLQSQLSKDAASPELTQLFQMLATNGQSDVAATGVTGAKVSAANVQAARPTSVQQGKVSGTQTFGGRSKSGRGGRQPTGQASLQQSSQLIGSKGSRSPLVGLNSQGLNAAQLSLQKSQNLLQPIKTSKIVKPANVVKGKVPTGIKVQNAVQRPQVAGMSGQKLTAAKFPPSSIPANLPVSLQNINQNAKPFAPAVLNSQFGLGGANVPTGLGLPIGARVKKEEDQVDEEDDSEAG